MHGARTIVDEAHAIGTLGPDGRGAIAEAGLEGEVDVVVGTLGKALGSYGAYACASDEMVRYLINTRALADLLDRPAAARRRRGAGRAGALGERPHRVAAPAQQRPRRCAAALADEGFPVADERHAHRPADRRRRAQAP